jgi:hypothetical protein
MRVQMTKFWESALKCFANVLYISNKFVLIKNPGRVEIILLISVSAFTVRIICSRMYLNVLEHDNGHIVSKRFFHDKIDCIHSIGKSAWNACYCWQSILNNF